MVSLPGGTPDSDSFRHEAIAILHRAIGVDGWAWLLTDPGARLPVHVSGENRVVDQALRRFFRMLPQAWNEPGGPGARPPGRAWRPAGRSLRSAADRGRPAARPELAGGVGTCGVGEKMRVQLNAGGACWALVHLHRDSARRHYSEEDIKFAAGVAPLLAPRVRADMRAPGPRDADPAPEPGRSSWIRTSPWSPPPSRPGGGSTAWASAGLIPQSHCPRTSTSSPRTWRRRQNGGPPGCAAGGGRHLGGYPGRGAHHRVQVPAGDAVTLGAAPADDLVPLLMRAWRLTPRERQVAGLVIDGLSTEDIATALFISVHTVRDHLKMMFGKMGVSRRQDLAAALAGRTPTAARAAP